MILTFLNSIWTGVVANLLFAVFIVYVFQQIRYWLKLRRHYHKKIFNTYWKMYPDEIVQVVTCKVKGNKICFEGSKNSDKQNIFEGQFIINPINLKFGEGYHIHKSENEKDKNASERFGFDKIIIKDDKTFFVDSPYVKTVLNEKGKKNGDPKYQVFVWRKQ
jgi:hypothetical protein